MKKTNRHKSTGSTSQSKQEFFKPIVAASLALSLSTFALASDPTPPSITIAESVNADQDKSDALGISWISTDSGSNNQIFKPAQKTEDPKVTQPFENLTLKYGAKGNLEAGTLDNSTQTFQAIVKNKDNATDTDPIKTTLDAKKNTIQMGANGAGTLTVDFDTAKKGSFVFTADKVANAMDGENVFAFIGNIVTTGGVYDKDASSQPNNSVFSATFSNNVKGNITLNHGGKVIDPTNDGSQAADYSKALVFENNSRLVGNLTVGGQDADIVFKASANPDQNRKETAGISGKVSKTANVDLRLRFDKNGKIGRLDSSGAGAAGNTEVTFGGNGEIGDITREINQEESVQEKQIGKTTITLKGDKKTTNEIGNVRSSNAGDNIIKFMTDTSSNTVGSLTAEAKIILGNDKNTDYGETRKRARNMVVFGKEVPQEDNTANAKNTIKNGITSHYGINAIVIKSNETEIGGRLLALGGITSISGITSDKQVAINGPITTGNQGKTLIRVKNLAIKSGITTGNPSSSGNEDVTTLVAEQGTVKLTQGINTLNKTSQTNIQLGKSGATTSFEANINNYGQTNIVLKNATLGGNGKALNNFDGRTNLVLNQTEIEKQYKINNFGGETNVILSGFQKDKNSDFDVNYSRGVVNLIFSVDTKLVDKKTAQGFLKADLNAEDQTLQAEEIGTINTSTDITKNQVFNQIYHNGTKLTLQKNKQATSLLGDFANQAAVANIATTVSTTEQKTTLTTTLKGLLIGSLSSLDENTAMDANPALQQDLILSKNSVFIGDLSLKLKHASLILQSGSKLVIAGESNHAKAQNLKLDSGVAAFDPTQSLQNIFGQTNTIIDLAGADFYNTPNRTDFRLLEIGKAKADLDTDKNEQAPEGFVANEKSALFRVYVNSTAANTTLGKTSDGAGGVNTYGEHYSDRIVIHNSGNNQTASTQNLQVVFDANTDLNSIKYTSGGTETKGNIAIATVVNTTNNAMQTISGEKSDSGVVNFKAVDTLFGFDAVQTTLKGVYTDRYGKTNKDKTAKEQNDANQNNYTTYFLSGAKNLGVSQAHQQASTLALGVNYDLYLANFNSLNKRMGELRNNPNTQGTWLRIFNGSQNNDFSLSKNLYTTLQGGYDYAFKVDEGSNYVGFAISYINSSSKLQEAGKQAFIDLTGASRELSQIQSNGVEFALYNAYVQDEGWYNDTIAKVSYIYSTFKKDAQSHKTQNLGFSLSNEVGYRFKLGEDKTWFIDPQVEFGFGYLDQSSFNQTLGLHTLKGTADALYTLRSRAGTALGYDFKSFTQDSALNASVYVGAFYEYDYIRGGNINLTTSKTTNVESKFKSDGRFVLNVGTNLEIKDQTRLYFDFEKSFGGKITTDYQVNLGVRYSFGDKVQNNLDKEAPKKQETKQSLNKEQAEETTDAQSAE